jgi:hypothetical protein
LAQGLATEGPDGLAWSQRLERALICPSGDWLFSVDDRPVIAMWGHVGPEDALPPDPVVSVAQSAPASSSRQAEPALSMPAVQSSPATTAAMPAAAVATTTVQATESRTGLNASPPTVATPSAGVRPRWLPAAVAVLGLATLALVGLAAWRLAAAGLLPGFGGLDDRIAAAASRNADLQSRLQARSDDGQPCRTDDQPPGAGKGAAPSVPSPATLPGRSTPTRPASQDETPTPAVPDRPATAPPAMPQMPQMPKLPDLPGTAPAPRSLQLPPTSSLAAPFVAGLRLAPGHRAGPLRRNQA